MNFSFFASFMIFVVFLIWLGYEMKKHSRYDEKKQQEYWTRERKANTDKREIIQCLDDALCGLVDDVKIVNPEREIEFIYNDIRYKIVLSAG